MDPAPANSSSSSSSAKKSKLDEDVRTYCEILARCSLPDVAKWKDEDLERAFKWSGYFRQVRKFMRSQQNTSSTRICADHVSTRGPRINFQSFQVHSRCLHRASLMEKFDRRFREIGHEGGWRFAGESVSYAFFGTSQEYLTKVHTH